MLEVAIRNAWLHYKVIYFEDHSELLENVKYSIQHFCLWMKRGIYVVLDNELKHAFTTVKETNQVIQVDAKTYEVAQKFNLETTKNDEGRHRYKT